MASQEQRIGDRGRSASQTFVEGTVISQFMLDGRMAASKHAGAAATLKVATTYQE
jgi:hypothetical protein